LENFKLLFAFNGDLYNIRFEGHESEGDRIRFFEEFKSY